LVYYEIFLKLQNDIMRGPGPKNFFW